jgi:type I restriction enzyme M protein
MAQLEFQIVSKDVVDTAGLGDERPVPWRGASGGGSIAGTVKGIQDVMRKDAGVDGDAQRISQLGWMIFLKLFDDKEQEYELIQDAYRSPIPEPLRWRSWAADPEGMTGADLLAFVDQKVFPALKGETVALDGAEARVDDARPIGLLVRAVFEDAYNYMKSGTLLRQVANRLNEIDFTASQDRHVFNDVYETILRDLQSAGNAGEYYTPRAVTRFMAERVDPALGDVVFDPACGTGGFLVDAIEHLRRKGVDSVAEREQLQRMIRGVEKKPLPHLLCLTNLILHDVEVPNVRRDNSLARPLVSYGPADRVDVVLTNPPFGGVEEDGVENNFPQAFRTRETADLFMALILRLLKDGGRAAVVLPDGFLFGEGTKTRLKEALLRECDLHTIVRLPNGVFAPYTSINTNLLFFEKGRPTRETWYVAHPLPEGYKQYSKMKPIRHVEFAYLAEWWADRKETAWAWRVPAEEIARRGYNLDVKNPATEYAEDTRSSAEALADLIRVNEEIAAALATLRGELQHG